jgi:membrane carboxypeptidase/penicillin-binding protein PbpC
MLTGEPNGDRVRLTASVDGEAPLFWYLDDHYLGTSHPEAPVLLVLSAGTHKLTCMAPGGEIALVHFEVSPPGTTPLFRAS